MIYGGRTMPTSLSGWVEFVVAAVLVVSWWAILARLMERERRMPP